MTTADLPNQGMPLRWRLNVELQALEPASLHLMQSLEERIERFCASAPLGELKVVFHSTGVNYAHQLYVLSLFGIERLRQLRSVHFVSGSVIAAIVFYSHQTGNLRYRRGDAQLWERLFFAAHSLRPIRSMLRLPLNLLRRSPVLCGQALMDVIRKGIGSEFGDWQVSFLPENFHFWLYDNKSSELLRASADNHLSFIKLAELAVASSAMPGLLHPLEISGFHFVDPVFSPGRKLLAARLREDSGPTLVSNMLIDRVAGKTEFLRPHRHGDGRMLMARELLQFCMGISNRDHRAALEDGLLAWSEETALAGEPGPPAQERV